MKIFDSLNTINKYHDIYKSLDSHKQEQFSQAVFGLFDHKQVSEEGVFSVFKITENDLKQIKSLLV